MLVESSTSYPQNSGESGLGGNNLVRTANIETHAVTAEKMEVIPFQAITNKNTKLENVAETYNLQFALAVDGLLVLRGVAKVKAAEPIAAKGIIGKVTSSALVNRKIKVGTEGSLVSMVIKPNGEIETLQELTAGTEISFDGITVST